ncbi:hypothetical protein AB6A40_009139 [Gnathostoma spinigerum]|uniref:GOLD domain-containing protein n=1 Tax=Gnathostoma spinigerum TaxID=75299 RepID=A0ABD6ER32_9BILA
MILWRIVKLKWSIEECPSVFTSVYMRCDAIPSDVEVQTPLMFIWAIIACLFVETVSIELTFELEDNAEQCFYEEIKKGADCVFEFQVVLGGKYDVDLTLTDPHGKEIYQVNKKQYDSYSWKAEVEGPYKACFSNKFSTFTHKVVYMDWQKGEEGTFIDQLKLGAKDGTPRSTAMTQLEMSATAVGDRLRLIDDYQTHHRLREATGRKRAEELNERVLYWSLGQTAVILIIGVAQVVLLRSFFTEKRTYY